MIPFTVAALPSIPNVDHAPTIPLQHLVISNAPAFACDHGIVDLVFTKTDGMNQWNLYVKCNGDKRTYKITIQ